MPFLVLQVRICSAFPGLVMEQHIVPKVVVDAHRCQPGESLMKTRLADMYVKISLIGTPKLYPQIY